jgi:hypothetical protein
MEKLLCQGPGPEGLLHPQTYTALSQCLALDINMLKYLFLPNPASTKAMMELVYDQIANHIRVCMAIKDDIESLRGIAPSEPILLEAASRIMLLRSSHSHYMVPFC